MTLVKRLVKGSAITAAEHDGNMDHVLDMANMTEAAAAKVLTADERTKLTGIAASANNYVHPNHTGDVTSTGDGATAIANDAVTNAKLANMASATIKGRATAETGDPEDLEIADNAAVRSAAAGRPLVAANIAAAAAIVTLDDDATIAVAWGGFINGEVTLTDNRTLGLPSAGQPGTWRRIAVIQDGTGSRTLDLAAGYVTVGGAALTLTTEAGSIDVLSIFCRTAEVFEVFSALDMKAPA